MKYFSMVAVFKVSNSFSVTISLRRNKTELVLGALPISEQNIGSFVNAKVTVFVCNVKIFKGPSRDLEIDQMPKCLFSLHILGIVIPENVQKEYAYK